METKQKERIRRLIEILKKTDSEPPRVSWRVFYL